MNNDIFKNPEVCEFHSWVKNKLDENDSISSAFNLAYRDVQRTLRGFGKYSEKKLIKNKCKVFLKDCYTKLITKIISMRAFDEWHENLCNGLKAIFDSAYHLTYGQAQKLVNMFFKYMYLLDDRVNAILPYLHIPIDNIILDGVINKSSYFSLQKTAHLCQPWSRLDNYEIYSDFQKEWRHISRGTSYGNSLLYEFYLWNKWHANEATKQFEVLTDYLEYFQNTDRNFYHSTNLPSKALHEKKVTVMQYPIFDERLEKFESIAYHFPIYNYDDVIRSYGYLPKDIEENIDLGKCDSLITLVFLTAIIRGEHFCNGLIADMAKKGIIYKLLLRLKEIDDSRIIKINT